MPNSAAISERAEAIPAAPQSWSDSTSPDGDDLHRRLDQLLARERIADLHRGPLLRRVLVELLAREDGRAADPVAPGRRPVQEDRLPAPRRLRTGHPVGREQADAHRVHETVVPVGLVEDGLAADRGHADAVAVVADTADGAREVPVRLGEAEPVEQRDRSGAHRDDVPEDAADAGRGALERLDRGGMVVALDLEGDRELLPEVEDAGVLPRPLEHALARAREALEEERGVLVAAVLRPEEREDRELEVVRVAAEQGADALVLPVGQAEGAMERLLRHAAHRRHHRR